MKLSIGHYKNCALLIAVLMGLILPNIEGNRLASRLNQFRQRFFLNGTRYVWYSDEMEVKAKEFADECKFVTEDGELGIVYGPIKGDDNAVSLDSVARGVLTKIQAKDYDNIENNYINMVSPKAYLIGCANNKKCDTGSFFCVLNKKVEAGQIIPVTNPCDSCSPTFSKCETNICLTEDKNIPSKVPEDEPEVISNNEGNYDPKAISPSGQEEPLTGSASVLGHAMCFILCFIGRLIL